MLSADLGQWPLPDAGPGTSLLVDFSAAGVGSGAEASALASVSGQVRRVFNDGTRLVVLGQGVDGRAAAARLALAPGVAFAVPDATIQASAVTPVTPVTPNDPSYSQQWGLSRQGGIDAPAAWAATTGDPATIVAIVDTGIDTTHPEFAGRLWTNPADGSHGYNFITNTTDPTDDNGHGSHVAGIIAATGNDGIGVAGVNWRARIMALKFLDASGHGSTSAAIAAIEFAADHGARVINASWGSGTGDPALASAITYAGTKGAVFVAAAGNAGTDNDASPFYPASFHLANMLTVAAVDESGGLAGFSNYGATSVDVGAPGANVYSTFKSGGYANMSGTSMAAPFVSGVVSLVAGLLPDATAAQLVEAVRAGVRPLASLAGKTVTGGIVSAPGAVAAAQALVTAPRAPSVRVLDGPTVIPAGGAGVTFDPATTGTPVSKTFTVSNAGAADLVLAGPIGVPAGYAVTAGFGATTLAPGASTMFTVALVAASSGHYAGSVNFATNDPASPTVRVAVAGTVADPLAPIRVVDDGDWAGFATTGTWIATPGGSPGGSTHVAINNGSEVATWTFGVVPGHYRISTTWLPSGAGSLAPYAVSDGSAALSRAPVSPAMAPLAFDPSGITWKDLGSCEVTTRSLVVTLSESASLAIAAAVRIDKV